MWGHSLQHIVRDAGDDDATKEALSCGVASSVSVERYRHALQDGIKMQGALTALSMHGNVERQNTENPKGPLHASTPQSMGRVLRLRWFFHLVKTDKTGLCTES